MKTEDLKTYFELVTGKTKEELKKINSFDRNALRKQYEQSRYNMKHIESKEDCEKYLEEARRFRMRKTGMPDIFSPRVLRSVREFKSDVFSYVAILCCEEGKTFNELHNYTPIMKLFSKYPGADLKKDFIDEWIKDGRLIQVGGKYHIVGDFKDYVQTRIKKSSI